MVYVKYGPPLSQYSGVIYYSVLRLLRLLLLLHYHLLFLCAPATTAWVTVLVRVLRLWPFSHRQVVTIRLRVMVPVREICGEKNVDEWDGNAETVKSTAEGTQTKEEMNRKEGPQAKLPRFYGRSSTYFLLLLLLLHSRPCWIFSPVSKAKSAVCRSVSTGPQSFLWASTGLGRVWRLKALKVGQDCRMWLGV